MKSFLSLFSRILEKIELFILGMGITLIAVTTIGNVLCRTFAQSLSFAEELCQFCIIWITFIGTAYAARKGRHIRMSAIYDQLPQKPKKGLMMIICLVTSLLMFLLAGYSVSYILTVKQIGTVAPATGVPLYLVYIAAPIGFAMAGIQYLLGLVKNFMEEEIYLSFDEKGHEHGEAVETIEDIGI